MKLSGYDEENMSLTDRALWWKTYQNRALNNIRQLRGRMNVGMKKALYKVC